MPYDFVEGRVLFFCTEKSYQQLCFIQLPSNSDGRETFLLKCHDIFDEKKPIERCNMVFCGDLETEFMSKIIEQYDNIRSKVRTVFPSEGVGRSVEEVFLQEIAKELYEAVLPLSQKIGKSINDIIFEALEKGLEQMDKEVENG